MGDICLTKGTNTLCILDPQLVQARGPDKKPQVDKDGNPVMVDPQGGDVSLASTAKYTEAEVVNYGGTPLGQILGEHKDIGARVKGVLGYFNLDPAKLLNPKAPSGKDRKVLMQIALLTTKVIKSSDEVDTDATSTARVTAVQALGGFNVDGGQFALAALTSPEKGVNDKEYPDVRAAAASAVAKLGKMQSFRAQAIKALTGLLGDKNADVREAAIDGLGSIGGADVVAILANELTGAKSRYKPVKGGDAGHEHMKVECRTKLVTALAIKGSGVAFEALRVAVKDPDSDVGLEAVKSLAVVKGEEVFQLLTAIGKAKPKDYPQDVRDAAAKAADEMGDNDRKVTLDRPKWHGGGGKGGNGGKGGAADVGGLPPL